MRNDYRGIGVPLVATTEYAETVNAVRSSLGKEIAAITLLDDRLRMRFTDRVTLVVWDDGQSCCESRYMRTDDDLSRCVGGTLTTMELRDAPSLPDADGEHEIQFLDVVTSRGVFQMASHNEHNGCYSGILIVARIERPAAAPGGEP